MAVYISAFADEVAKDFRSQVDFLVGEGIGYIELRMVNGRNIMELGAAELSEARELLRGGGIKVSAIGSPIGKVSLDVPWAEHLEAFKHAVELADYFETKLIRIFSYYSGEGRGIAESREEVMERMAAKARLVQGSGLVLVHENEAGIYGQTARRCVDMMETVNMPELRLTYDPGNFVCTEKMTNNVEICWSEMKKYVAHVHIKDRKVDGETGCLPGKGDGQVKELLKGVVQEEYEGFLTLEPHMTVSGTFSGFTGPENFSLAVGALRRLAVEVGLKMSGWVNE
ncbi:MAG: sugar phosphate isomerase/epimerase [Planctomycetes bacterium]|nr:sugar phosphate isomerase/epimerase [Planctomycetota bacterium]